MAYREHGDNMSAQTARNVFASSTRSGAATPWDRIWTGSGSPAGWPGHQRRAGRPLAAARAYLHGAREFRSGALLVRGLAVPLGERAMGIPATLRAFRGGQRKWCPPIGWSPIAQDWWRAIAHRAKSALRWSSRGSRWILANSTRGQGVLARRARTVRRRPGGDRRHPDAGSLAHGHPGGGLRAAPGGSRRGGDRRRRRLARRDDRRAGPIDDRRLRVLHLLRSRGGAARAT